MYISFLASSRIIRSNIQWWGGDWGLRSCELLAPYCTQSLEQVATEDLWQPDPGSHRVKRQTVHKVLLCLSLASLHLHILKLTNSSTMVWREHKFFHPISRNMKWKLYSVNGCVNISTGVSSLSCKIRMFHSFRSRSIRLGKCLTELVEDMVVPLLPANSPSILTSHYKT